MWNFPIFQVGKHITKISRSQGHQAILLLLSTSLNRYMFGRFRKSQAITALNNNYNGFVDSARKRVRFFVEKREDDW